MPAPAAADDKVPSFANAGEAKIATAAKHNIAIRILLITVFISWI